MVFPLFSYSCVLNTMCAVTASTVIDFAGHAHSVPDRCGYTLMTSSAIPGLQVLAVFQERRRRDVSFLDRVLLQLNEGRVQISLEQGSRVYVSWNCEPTNVVVMWGQCNYCVHGGLSCQMSHQRSNGQNWSSNK